MKPETRPYEVAVILEEKLKVQERSIRVKDRTFQESFRTRSNPSLALSQNLQSANVDTSSKATVGRPLQNNDLAFPDFMSRDCWCGV